MSMKLMTKSVTKKFLVKCLRNKVGTKEIELIARRIRCNDIVSTNNVRNVKDVILVLKRRVQDAVKKENDTKNEYVQSKNKLKENLRKEGYSGRQIMIIFLARMRSIVNDSYEVSIAQHETEF